MKNRNRLDLGIIPVGGIDKSIECSKCPSACCRAGMAIPLSQQEAQNLQEAGTEMRKMARSETKGNRPGRGRNFYQLESDCGNLVQDGETGQTSCGIHEDEDYPKACREFKAGSYTCALVQLYRIEAGQDTSQ